MLRKEEERPVDAWAAMMVERSKEPAGELRMDDSRNVDMDEIAREAIRITEEGQRK